MAYHDAATPEDLSGARYSYPSRQEEYETELADRVVYLLNIAVLPYRDGGQTVVRCEMCSGRDGEHTDPCPVPLLELWLSKQH